ncbi:MAG: response regulator transcription factor [Clostridia bacterium]|nr:response regulator transcription factor [Clostridia bacterium]
MHILLAEDEQAMAEAIVAFLQYHQYTVDWVDNGTDAYDQASRIPYDGLILDIMMPGMDGLTVLSRLRRDGKTMPVLLLTAKGEVEHRIAGFEQGADDYLPKPFDMTELMMRVRAMLRRRDTYHSDLLTLGDMALDQSKCALSVGSASASLSRREFQLMEFLMNNPGIYFSADTLLDRVWGMDAITEQGTVWVHISYLRKKMASLGAHAVIQSKRGIGYALEETP